MTILSLIEADGVKLKKYGATYRGRCPFHNGKTETSLLVDVESGKYHCFGCDSHGDEIQWLRERRGLSFMEACDYLGRDPGPRSNGPRPAPSAWAPREVKAPPEAWQAKARTFLDRAIDSLWAPGGKAMRKWLHNVKGLSDKTIRAASLGYNPADIYELRAVWGLAPAIKEDGTERRQWIPAGLVIPLVIDGAVHRLRIRRSDSGDKARYVIVSGSSSAPMAWGQGKGAAVVVESELDAILLHQDVGDLAAVVSMGSATAKPDKITHEGLIAVELILVSLDSDVAGARAVWAFWPATYGAKIKRCPCVKGKDPSEAWANGLDLRSWAVAGIFGTKEKFERFCIQTIDGGLTDKEAIKAMGQA